MLGAFYMNDNYLQPIYNETDLEMYENFINSTNFKITNNDDFQSFLNSNIGNCIKLFITIGSQLITRQGKLLKVCNDYIILSQPREKLAVKLCDIKFLSVM